MKLGSEFEDDTRGQGLCGITCVHCQHIYRWYLCIYGGEGCVKQANVDGGVQYHHIFNEKCVEGAKWTNFLKKIHGKSYFYLDEIVSQGSMVHINKYNIIILIRLKPLAEGWNFDLKLII